ncbi:MAG: GGDEF domain-containing protein [Lachnospiraceae bacterium]|nr:GGDEF domain-containing protein [Lachnospiraceae bacterium]
MDMKSIRQFFEYKPLKNIFDRIYIVDLDSRCCQELATADLTALPAQSYDNWLISFAEKMYKPDSAEFFGQMDLERICLSLTEQAPCYIVYCRQTESICVREYQLNICFSDESRTQVTILRQELSNDYPRPLETMNELSRCNTRFQFLVDRLAEDFIEINVETGLCRMFHANNGMQERRVFKEQIAWWAENLIVPEEREAYIKEYALESLMQYLKANNGFHRANYTTLSSNTPQNLLIISTLVKESYGKPAEYIFAYSQDITQMKIQETRNQQLVDISQQLLTLSQTEPVTGLLNRAACEKLIEKHLSCSKNAISGTMLLIDIDRFKNFNDQYGHSTGDFVLKFLGKAMRDIFRSDDIVSRWGGDEFVVFMRDVFDERMITSRIERLRVRLLKCKKEDQDLPITISIGGGIAILGMTMKDLFEHCDKSLYEVKSNGRNNYLIYSD